MKTTQHTVNTRKRNWYQVDATDQILGRLASRIAIVLMGKHKPDYTPHIDTGDFVIVTNSSKIQLTGKKAEQMEYRRFSGYHGGLKRIPFAKMMEKKPNEIIRLAVKRMLPKNKLAYHQLNKLKIYAEAQHEHAAQNPQPFPLVVKTKQ